MITDQSIRHPTETLNRLKTDQSAAKYVIQRTSETIREWWTGDKWSDDLSRAKRYDEKPDVSVESKDEMAKAILLDELDD